MTRKCLGCNEEVAGGRAHSMHLKSCKLSGKALGSTVRKRNAERQGIRAEKRARKEQRAQAKAAAAAVLPELEEELIVLDLPPPPDPINVSRVSGRVRRVPARIRDLLPSSYTGLPAHLRPPPAPATQLRPRPVSPAARPNDAMDVDQVEETRDTPLRAQVYRTEPDQFGLYRIYTIKPQRDPGGDLVFENRCDPVVFPEAAPPPAPVPHGLERATPFAYAPFPNLATFDLVYWQNDASNLKSHGQLNALARAMQEPGFEPHDLAKFESSREVARLDNYFDTMDGSPLAADDRWSKKSVTLSLPKEGAVYASEADAPQFIVNEVYLRSIVQVSCAAVQSPGARDWNFVPYKLFWVQDSIEDDKSDGPTPSQDSLDEL